MRSLVIVCVKYNIINLALYLVYLPIRAYTLDDYNKMHILLTIDDMYRLIMLVVLTILTIDSLSHLKQHLTRSFLKTHINDEMSRTLDHLTLMVVSKKRTDEVDSNLIKKYEHIIGRSANMRILAISKIMDYRDVFRKASRFKTTQFIAQVAGDRGINCIAMKILRSRIQRKKKFDKSLLEQGLKLEEQIARPTEFSGITFICFNSALDLLRFKRFINP